jgi:hypothetical protein
MLSTPFFIVFFIYWSDKESLEALKLVECSDVLNKAYLQKEFENITIIPLSSYRKQSNDAKSCGYTFFIGEIRYDSSLTLEVIGDATEVMLEQSVAAFKDKKFLMGLGEKAYIYPIGLAYQITVLSNKNLIHGYILEDDSQTLIFDREMSKKLLHNMLEKLDLS